MPVHIALLRAVNVGGCKLAMVDLKAMFQALEFTSAQTILQTGNVIFGGSKRTGAALEAFLESETDKRLKLRTDYLVRMADQWDAAIDLNPFPGEAKNDPSHLLMLPLKAAPAAFQLRALQAAIQGRERVRVAGRELFAYYPDGIGKSKLTLALIEKKLMTRATGRNWNTVLKIQAALGAAKSHA